MSHPAYEFVFPPIQDRPDTVQVNDNRLDKEFEFDVLIDDELLLIRRLWQPPMPEPIADLIDIGTAVFIADRLAYRPDNTRRDIYIRLPIRAPVVFGGVEVLSKLEKILHWYTEDNWRFTFTQRRGDRRLAEDQMKLPVSQQTNSIEVALWSGGLNSLAGAIQRLDTEPNKNLILFGTGSNSFINKKQKTLGKMLREHLDGRATVINVPIRYRGTKNVLKNKFGRARGFTFLLLGAACAWLNKQSTLFVYENGIGAINLPFRASEVGVDHSRAVHPYSLQLMSEFVTTILDTPFYFRNPFSFFTKATLVAALGHEAHRWYRETITCDRVQRKPNRPQQCGRCSSCLLRRQAIIASTGRDLTSYYVTDALSRGELPAAKSSHHLLAMLHQVDRIKDVLEKPNPWYEFARLYPEHVPIVAQALTVQEDMQLEQVQLRLMAMYESYVHEWDTALPVIRRGLLAERPERFPVAGNAA